MKHDAHTFKHDGSTVQAHSTDPGRFAVNVWGSRDLEARSSILPASDAPALALAILEAAGFVGDEVEFIGLAVANLRDHVEVEARRTAEAKEQAELEAEALELYKTYWSGNVTGFSNEPNRDDWINVARRAREMAERAEK